MCGDTANMWLISCIVQLIFSPISIFFELSMAIGAVLKKLGDVDEFTFDDSKRQGIMTMIAMAFGLLPITFSIVCLIMPVVFLTRLWQILKLLFLNILPQCIKRCCCCCCY